LSPYLSLLLTRPPPRSTLFPYTTLFRSDLQPLLHEREPEHERIPLARLPLERAGIEPQRRLGFRDVARHPVKREVAGIQHAACGDRKSTRLNSSHLVISYAVFCLKKKKK